MDQAHQPQYLLEIQNVSQELVVLTCPAKSPLMLVASQNGQADRVPLTAEQFLGMAYDIEGFVEGTHGVTKQLALWVTDRESGRSEPVPFEAGLMVAKAGMSADGEASAKQDKAQEKIDKKRAKILAQSKPTDPNTLSGAVEGAINHIERCARPSA